MNDVAPKERFEIEYQYENGQMVRLNPTIVRKYLVHGRAELVTDTEIVLFIQLCRYQNINPFLREAYLIKFSSNDPASIVAGKDWFTKKAGSIRECRGFNAGVIVQRKAGKDTELVKRMGTLVLEGETLVGGWSKVFRDGWQEALEIEVSLKEYMRFSKAGEPTRSWREMPATMIRKVALVQGLREAFSSRYEGLYSPEEMPLDDSKLPSEPIRIPEIERVVDRKTDPDPVPPQEQVPEEAIPAEAAGDAKQMDIF